MPLYLDSAAISDAQTAAQLGWVAGITTNPALMAQSSLPADETLRQLAKALAGPVFYQPIAATSEGIVQEIGKAGELIGEQLVAKIPATAAGFTALARLSPILPCAVTTVYSPAQALVARAAGAKYLILYYNRSLRLLPDGGGLQLIRQTVKLLAGSQTIVLAASLKSAEEAASAALEGIEHLTLPLAVLQSLAAHPLSEETTADFFKNGRGIAAG